MKAVVLRAIGEPLVLADLPRPEVGPGEVLVQVQTCGICRTDLHIQDGLAYVPKLPHIPGHEPAGVVVDVGPGVDGPRVGDRVVPHLFVRSAGCRYTRSGQDAQATHLKGIIGVTLPGGFAELLKVPVANILPLPDEVPFDIGGLTTCAVVTAIHAFRKSELRLGDTAIVLGAGGIGLILVQLLKAAGVRVLALDREADARAAAFEAGADAAIPIDEMTADVARYFGDIDGEGVDVVFELVGRTDTMAVAAACARRGGTLIVIGEEAEPIGLDTIQIAQRELRIVGSRNGGMQDALEAMQAMARGVIRPRIAATYPLDQINEAFDRVRSGQVCGRVVIRIRD
jgi:propanol-preferring alcohol dehydrogenase